MAMCGGVQKVSRPIDRCQEMSHCAPIIAEVTASAAYQTKGETAGVSDGAAGDPERFADVFSVCSATIVPPAYTKETLRLVDAAHATRRALRGVRTSGCFRPPATPGA